MGLLATASYKSLSYNLFQQKNALTGFAKWPTLINQIQSELTGVVAYTDSEHRVRAAQEQ